MSQELRSRSSTGESVGENRCGGDFVFWSSAWTPVDTLSLWSFWTQERKCMGATPALGDISYLGQAAEFCELEGMEQ